MTHIRSWIIVLIVGGVAWLGLARSSWSPWVLAGYFLNQVRTVNDPSGTVQTEVREAAETIHPAGAPADDSLPPSERGNWPSYNRTLTSNRYSPLDEINIRSVSGLKILCRYDTGVREAFETGPIVVAGALIGTTAQDIFSIDPATCRENWRTHEEQTAGVLKVNRGAAYLDGRLFRGTLDGRVLAYDFKTGKRLWATRIAAPEHGEMVDAAPVAWNGLVFLGNAIGDFKGVKGRMYALSAETGEIVWETYLVPRGAEDTPRGPAGPMPDVAAKTWANAAEVPISGGGTWTSYSVDPTSGHLFVPAANPSPVFVPSLREGTNLFTNSVVELEAHSGAYVNHFQSAPKDWHDWDVSNTPAILTTRDNHRVMAFTPKNGYLYAVNLANYQLLYRSPVTRFENEDAPLSADAPTHFCPGGVGGGEWNGVAFDPAHNLLLSGETDWCTTVRLAGETAVKAIPAGKSWMGHLKSNPLDIFGTQDPHSQWAGWLYATDADTGTWKWRLKANYPILSGLTPTAGGLVFFGDMGGHFYAVDAHNGKRLWSQKLQGAIGGGVITYLAGGRQRVAVASGLTSILWPTEPATGQIVVLGLP